MLFGKPRKPTRAQLRTRERLAQHGHVWTCDHVYPLTAKDQERGRARGRRCGRTAAVVWCRVAGSGIALVARCSAHARPLAVPHSVSLAYQNLKEDEFECVPARDHKEWVTGRRVRAALLATGLDAPCPAPGRDGRHEIYAQGFTTVEFCKACGAKRGAPV